MVTAEIKESKKQELEMHEGLEPTRDRQVFIPRADIYESKDSITVLADMPGVNQNSVDITLEKNVLTINATVQKPEHQNHSLSYGEYQIGDYRRAFTLSNEIDHNGIEAVVKNGVLKLTLPKSKESLPKKIAIREG